MLAGAFRWYAAVALALALTPMLLSTHLMELFRFDLLCAFRLQVRLRLRGSSRVRVRLQVRLRIRLSQCGKYTLSFDGSSRLGLGLGVLSLGSSNIRDIGVG